MAYLLAGWLIIIGVVFVCLCLVFGIALAFVLIVVSIVSFKERRTRRERSTAMERLRGEAEAENDALEADAERGASRRRTSSLERAAPAPVSAAEVPNSRHNYEVVTVVNPAARTQLQPEPGSNTASSQRPRCRSRAASDLPEPAATGLDYFDSSRGRDGLEAPSPRSRSFALERWVSSTEDRIH
tara:strand:+ start:356 stop:910 length:555 start_codon:yes stop_codon:yes gene_type:complete